MSFNWFPHLLRRGPRTKNTTTRTSLRATPNLVRIEDRIAPAGIVPTPVTTGGTELLALTRITGGTITDFLGGGGTTSPVAPNQLVAVSSAVANAKSSLSVGFQNLTTGAAFITNVPQINDPVASATAVTKYTQSYMESVAYGRDGKIHVVSIQSSDDKSSGALVYNEFLWTAGGTPAPIVTNRILRQWAGSTDPVFHPQVFVNNNVASFTDPVSGVTRRDPLADPNDVYVFWNTNATATSQIGAGQAFNPHLIQFVASSDGGTTFGASRSVSDPTSGFVIATATSKNHGHTQPVVAFSPGNAATPGKLTVAWGATLNGGVYTDNSTPGNAAASSFSVTAGGGAIADGFDPGNSAPHIAGVTKVSFPPVNVTDPSFTSLADIDVKLAIVHPNMDEVQIRLGYDNNTPGNTADDVFAVLVRARTDATGTAAPAPPAPGLQQGLSGANLGTFVYQNTGTFSPGTIFDDSAARPINDTTTANPYVGTYRPEIGSLAAAFGGRNAAAMQGTWFIEIQDTRDTTTTPLIQNVTGATLSFTSAAATVGTQTFTNATPVAIADAAAGDVPQTTTSKINVPAITDPFFNKLSNLIVTTNITHPSNKDVSLQLTYDNNTPGNAADDISVTLVPTNKLTGFNIGPNAIFNQQAKNDITAFPAPYSNTFTPVAPGTLAAFNNRTAAQLVGNWTLSVTDSLTDAAAPTQSINSWSLRFDSVTGATLFGTDTKVSGRALQGSADGVNTLLPGVAPSRGVGPGVTIAYDNSLGTNNPTAGNLYLAFTVESDHNTDKTGDGTTDIYFFRQPNGGTLTGPFILNDDIIYNGKLGIDGTKGLDGLDGRFEPSGHFFESSRSQFMPAFAVDPTTGTLGVAWRDARWDASNTRVSTFFAASNDGGQSFSDQVFLNASHTAFNAITLDQVQFEPYPDNAKTMGTQDYGTRIGLAASGAGKFTAVWSGSAKTGNGDLTGGSIIAGSVQVAAGPRIISQSMGPVTTGSISSITVDFDRPIEASTFTTADVTVTFRAPGLPITDPGVNVPLASITAAGGTAFNINFATPQTKTGTYSYTIGSGITDRVRQAGGASGNLIDQNANGAAGAGGDVLFIDGRTIPDPFKPSLQILTQPLIIPGPRVIATSIPGQAQAPQAPDAADGMDNLVLNAAATAIDLTFDRDMDPASFTLADIIRFTGPAGPIVATTVIPIDARTFRVGFPAQSVSGSYAIDVSSDISSTAGERLDTNLNAGLDVLRGGSILSGPVLTKTYNSVAAPVAFGPGGTATMTISVPDTFLLQQTADKRIQIKLNVTYSNTPDLVANLIAPDGTRFRLFTNVGSPPTLPQANFVNTVLDDAPGNTPIQIAGAPFDTGPYNPQLPLSKLLADPNRRHNGDWQLEIINQGGASGTINNFSLTLPYADSSNGLGEPIADRVSTGFRVFIQDPLNPAARSQWTPVGASSSNETSNSSRLSAITRDPSDPSGNTWFAGGASGGVWKTTNFLTSDPDGPNWIPITDFGPTTAVNIGSIAVFPRNGDPNQTIVFALTGEGNVGSPGVGVLRSLDGGRTWKVLDSTRNADAAGNILPIDARGTGPFERDGVFLGATGFEIITDPKLSSNGKVIVYMAVSGNANQAGVWRSVNSGETWFRIRAGQAVDVQLAAGSASTTAGASGNLEILYAAFQGEGVFLASQAATTTTMTLMNGGQGNPLLRDVGSTPSIEVTIGAPSSTPNGAKGRIVLATPTFKDNLLENTFYQGWLYALVVTPAGNHEGLYVTKDYGRNWTKIRIPVYNLPNVPDGAGGWGSNDDARPDLDVFSQGGTSTLGAQGNYDIAISLDPTDPQIVYMSGLGFASTANIPVRSTIRVDTRTLSDPGTFVFTDNTRSQDANLPPSGTTGPAVSRNAANGLFGDVLIPPVYAFPYGAEFTNLSRDPQNPFIQNSTIRVTNTKSITNDGTGSKYTTFAAILAGVADVHRITSFTDPVTGRTRLVFAGDQGLQTGVDRGDGILSPDIGFADVITANRNGNLQINQFYTGAAQPSQLAADLAGAFFYGLAQDNGFPVSARDIIRTGNLNWRGPAGDGNGVATDALGSGTVYQYRWPCCQGDGADSTDFFRVFLPTAPDPSLPGNLANESNAFGGGISRTFGLLQAGDNPGTNAGQWPLINAQVGKFAVNPIDAQGLLIGSLTGRFFRTTNQGVNWFVVAEPGQLDGTLVQAPAFGSPDPALPGEFNNFLYAGTAGGRIFMSTTGQAPWTNISAGLDGSAVQVVSANTEPGSAEAFAVTLNGVYHMRDSKAANPVWENITGNLFELNRSVFGELTTDVNPLSGLQYLQALAVDWRYNIPEDPADPDSPVFPILYVGGQGGVFRSVDRGTEWTFFPDVATDGAAVEGGYLSNALVTDLDLSIGDLDPATGEPRQAGGYNLLLATTYGRGSFAIRLDPNLDVPGALFQSGPQVTSLGNPNAAGGPSSTLRVFFNSPVEEITFGTNDIQMFDTAGNPVTITGVTRVLTPAPFDPDAVNRFDTYDITFTPQTVQGFYRLTVGPELTDLAGNRMNQNANGVNGESDDAFDRWVWLNSANGTVLTLSALPTTVVAGTSHGVTAQVFNKSGQTDTGYTGTVTFTSTDGQAGLPPAYTFTAADQGTKAFTVTLKTAGAQSVILSGTAGPAVDPAKVTTVVVNAPASQFFVSGLPASVVAGTGQNITVEAKDAFGNLAADYVGTVTFTSTDGKATLPPDTTLTAGVGTFGVILITAGPQTVTAADTIDATLTGTVSTLVTPAAATKFDVTGPTTVVAGNKGMFTVVARDPFGNVDTNYAGTVKYLVSDPAAPAIAAGPLTAGTGTVSTTFFTAGAQNVVATDTVTTTITGTAALTVVAAAANAFFLTNVPTTTVAGVAFSPTVTAKDQFGNVATGYTGTVRITTTDAQGSTPAASKLTNGVGTFSTVTLRTAGNQTVTAVDTVNAALTVSAPVTVTAAAASALFVTNLPSSVTASQPAGFTVTAKDAFGNLAPSFAGTVSFGSSDPIAVFPPSYTFVPATDKGTRNFTGTFNTPGLQTLTASTAGPVTAGSASTTVQSLGAYVITGVPATATAGLAYTVTVTARDTGGNIITGYTGTADVALTDGTGTAPTTVTFTAADQGVVTFPVIFRALGSQTLTVSPTAGVLSPGTVTTTVVNAGRIAFTLPAGVTAGVPFTVTVRAEDFSGTTLVGYEGAVAFTSTDPAATLPGTITFTAADNGQKDVTFTLRTAGAKDITATATVGVLDPATRTTAVAAAAASTFLLTNVPTSAPANDPFTFTVTAKDAFGNLADGYGGTVRITSSDPRATLPANATLAAGVGSFTVTPRTVGGQTITASDATTGTPTATAPVTVTSPPPPPATPAVPFAVGSGTGFSVLRVFNPNGTASKEIIPFGVGAPFTGGLRVATADFNGDGVPDYVVGTGPGVATQVKVINGSTGTDLFSIAPFEASFTGGVYVAAGDLNGDGKAELAITPDEGGGPRVRVFDGNGFGQLADFFGIDDPNFRGGARPAFGDLNGDNFEDLIVAAGFGGGPRVAAFDGSKLTPTGGPKLFGDFFVFEESLRNGVFVTAGDLNGDGRDDLIVGGGPGGGPRVFALSGLDLTLPGNPVFTPIVNFFAGNPADRNGVRVGTGELNGDGIADLIVGSGSGSRIAGYLGTNLTVNNFLPFFDVNAFDGGVNGVFVG
jgi:subtilisin-like proprotein convertase family protein